MNFDQFAELAASGYNRIPLVEELLADLDTPVSSYLKLAAGPNSFLLESVQGGETWGRYSIIGLPCNTIVRATGHNITVSENDEVVENHECAQPLDFIEQFQQRYSVPEIAGLPNFYGGLVGYFAYDTARYAEPRLNMAAEKSVEKGDLVTPDIVLMLAEEVLVFDNLAGTLKIIVLCDPKNRNAFTLGTQRLAEIKAQIRSVQPTVKELDLSLLDTPDKSTGGFSSATLRSDYLQAVEKIKDYILAGDCMQVVLSQRLSAAFSGDSFDLYRALRLLNPSPYMYYLNLGDFEIVGSSPEILARLEDNTVTVRPIAGTRRRGKTTAEDQALEQELLADPKELAEHLMLIDLGRNDIGRIAKTASVNLEEQMIVERYSHVMHIVSKVSGELQEEHSAIDVLRSCLPAGTLSGAPKIRAMEIIEELEPVKRGIYGGAIGYIGWSGEMDTAIAIRTAVIKDKTIYLQAGAGIVADSSPELEWEECMNKAQAVIQAVKLCC